MTVNAAVPALSDAVAGARARGASPQVIDAIGRASARTGVSFAYLLEKAAVESGFRTGAKASTSSATGLYQFTEGTWLDMVERHGGEVGLGREATALADGSADAAMRARVLDRRTDARLSAHMAAAYTAGNRTELTRTLDRPVDDTDLYLAHFLGARGAADLLQALDRDPATPAAALLPKAAAANRPVFYDGQRARTVQEVYDRYAGRFGDGDPRPAPAAVDPAAVDPDVVRVAGSTSHGFGGTAGWLRPGATMLSPEVAIALARLEVPGVGSRDA